MTTGSITTPALVAFTMLCAGTAAQAQVYRCGNSYSQSPCAGGQQVDTHDPRSAAQASQAREATVRDARLAGELEKARLAREAQVKPGSAPVTPVPAVAPATEFAASKPLAQKAAANKGGKAPKAKDGKPEHFTAVLPPPAKAKTSKKND